MIPHDFRFRDCDRFVVDQVFNKREYALASPREGERVLDLGAHVGSFTRWALDQGAGHVTAVEAAPETVALLRGNVALDPRVTVIAAAVVGAPLATATLALPPRGNPMGAYVVGTKRPAGKSYRGYQLSEVATVSLPYLLEIYQPTLVKFDIEASEYDVLTPHVDLLRQQGVRCLIGEYHVNTQALLDRVTRLVSLLDAAGYTRSRSLPGKPTGWGRTICHDLAP